MGKSRRICLRLSVGVVCCCGSPSASADYFTFYFEGKVSFIRDYLDLDESVYVGAPFSGGYTFDPTGVTDYYPGNPNVGSYYFGDAGRMWTQIGNYQFVTLDLGILIWNDLLSGDVYAPISFSVLPAGGVQWNSMAVQLIDETAAALDSDALPTGVPDMADFPTFAGFAMHLPGNTLGIGGRLTSLTPEPGSLAILCLGAAFVVARRRH